MVTRHVTSRGAVDPTGRIELIIAQAPELAPWLQLYREVLALSAHPGWEDAVASIALATDRAADQPLLTGAAIPLDRALATETLRRLLTAASDQPTEDASATRAASHAAELGAPFAIQAAINQDAAGLDAAAVALDLAPTALAAIAHLAAIPLLRAAHRALATAITPDWGQGYCPLCGAWPAVAEVRGLESTRHLRCGRCGADWTMPTLWCPFCGEHDHAQLGSLRAEVPGGSHQAETCLTCRGYVKTMTTLRAWPAEEVPLADIASVEWDLAAMEREFARPDRSAMPLNVTIEDAV
ncbi:MAG: formate dehydrogenase accessory protein FdhE [Chloroflexia bacterium]|nr:formate dehydrogenase accessory protein FdhE [Chloroflexia bacterium]